MPQRIFFDALAKAQLRSLDKEIAMRILIALTRLLNLNEGDVKKLEGYDPPQYRLRVGDYRVRFYRADDTLRVIAVKHRREAYR